MSDDLTNSNNLKGSHATFSSGFSPSDHVKIFFVASIVCLAFGVGLGVIIFHLAKNYDESQELVYENLQKEKDFVGLFASLKKSEIDAYEFLQTASPEKIEGWSKHVHCVENYLVKISSYEDDDESSDIEHFKQVRQSVIHWRTETSDIFHSIAKYPISDKNRPKVSETLLQTHAAIQGLWQSLHQLYEKESYDRLLFEKNLKHIRERLWVGLIIVLVGLAAALLTTLWIFWKYLASLRVNARIAEENEARYRSIVEDQMEFICRFKPDGTFLFVNDVYCRFFGKAKEELVGSKWGPIVHPDDLERVKEELKAISPQNTVVVIENRVHNAAGEIRWAQFVNRAWFKNGKLYEVQSVGRDITELKSVQERLEQVNSQLELRVAERTKELEDALEKARATQKDKETFLAILSHEMRTPLHSIVGFTEMALGTSLDQTQRHYLENIRSQNQTLLSLINDILDLGRLESKELTLENTSFPLSQLVEGAVSGLQPLADKKGLKLSYYINVSSPRQVLGDPMRLRQILVNLLGNAIKYTNTGNITLGVKPSSLSPDLQEGKTTFVTFEIRDTGVGIPKNRFLDIFKLYGRIESTATLSTAGTGLGLTITKRLVDLMGGKIWLESEVGKGSAFFVEIPLVNARSSCEADPSISPGINLSELPAGSLNILVVEDNAMASELLKDFLFKMGLWADYCTNGTHAIEMVNSREYDLIFIDLNLPDLTGDIIATSIRSNPRLKFQPILIGLSASTLHEDRKRCIASGMDDFLIKPCCANDLSATIEKWSGRIIESKMSTVYPAAARQNFEELSRRLGMDSWKVITRTFQEETPAILKKLLDAGDCGDRTQVRHLTHYLQGGADILGAKPLSSLCLRILDSASESITIETRSLIAQLNVEVQSFLESLNSENV